MSRCYLLLFCDLSSEKEKKSEGASLYSHDFIQLLGKKGTGSPGSAYGYKEVVVISSGTGSGSSPSTISETSLYLDSCRNENLHLVRQYCHLCALSAPSIRSCFLYYSVCKQSIWNLHKIISTVHWYWPSAKDNHCEKRKSFCKPLID